MSGYNEIYKFSFTNDKLNVYYVHVRTYVHVVSLCVGSTILDGPCTE